MPLFLLIRHGESTANRRDFVRALAARAERLTPRQAYARRLAEPREANGDPVLTDNGLRQAELLGRFWSKLLQHKATEGRVHVVVSPMTRNMQTADPLVRRLNAGLVQSLRSKPQDCATTVPAIVDADLFEIPGLFHPADADLFFRLQASLVQNPGDDARRLRQTMADYPWRPAGLSVDEIQSKFPWCTIPDGGPLASRRHEGWYRNGCESLDDISARVVRLADRIEWMRDTLPAKDVVVLFTHGLTHNMLMNLLMARQFLGEGVAEGKVAEERLSEQDSAGKNAAADARFRAVSRAAGNVFDKGWVGLNPGSNTSTSCLSWDRGAKMTVHFLHRVDHLGPATAPDTLMRGYQFLGLGNLQGQVKSRTHLVGYWGLRGGPDAKL